jgi:redox-sensitive bicupin YhaK (pirin superfamily)
MQLSLRFINVICSLVFIAGTVVAAEGETTMITRRIDKITAGNGRHWVGDGFPVNNMLSYNSDLKVSPFLLLDYAEPADFYPSDKPRGVDQHPHRGFETVTIVYHGELQHRDTAGNSGKIGPGDVQWMTAARGILHEEKHSDDFTRRGGKLEMVQLWVNLPAKYKMSEPHYQEITSASIPLVTLENGTGTLRVIAGGFGEVKSSVKTFTPINIYDIALKEKTSVNIQIPQDFNAMLLVLNGKISSAGRNIEASELAVFASTGDVIEINSNSDAKVLLMSGKPIDEPVAAAGPFVMNTDAEIKQAYNDFRSGKFLSGKNN